jgi:catechol 2,3-dioxygenase-like lactoylglutathione lyase family enzyme
MSDRWYSRPILFAADIQRMLDFYIGKLGFREGWRYEEGGQLVIAQVSRSDCELIFTRQESMRAGPGRIFISLDLDVLEAARAEFEARGIPVRFRRWGYHTLVVQDPDGNELYFPYPADYRPEE